MHVRQYGIIRSGEAKKHRQSTNTNKSRGVVLTVPTTSLEPTTKLIGEREPKIKVRTKNVHDDTIGVW